MREIKFRGYSKSFSMMFDYDMLEMASAGMVDICKRELKKIDPEATELQMGLFLPTYDKDLILMQYTGLKDKNGVEIYEGDIVEVTRKHWNNCNKEYLEKTTKELGVIEFFKNLQMSLKVKDKGYNLYQPLLWILEDDSEIEVIGNIYENSELLEGIDHD